MASPAFNADLGRTQFLQLLVAQVQYQNPLEPVEQQDFLGQLAQFSVLDGVQALNLQFGDMLRLQSLSQGASLVGKTVNYSHPLGGTETGVVSAARIADGNLMLTIGEWEVSLDKVSSIVADAAAA